LSSAIVCCHVGISIIVIAYFN